MRFLVFDSSALYVFYQFGFTVILTLIMKSCSRLIHAFLVRLMNKVVSIRILLAEVIRVYTSKTKLKLLTLSKPNHYQY